MTKKIYSITDLGRTTLFHWIENAEEDESNKDPFAIKVYFLIVLKTKVSINCSPKRKRKEEKLMHLQAIYNQLDAKSDLQHILILKKALLREQSYIDWLDFCLAEI